FDQTPAEFAEALIGGSRIFQDAGDVRIDRRLRPWPVDRYRHAETLQVLVAALTLEARHDTRIDPKIDRLFRQIDDSSAGHADERASQMKIVRLRLALCDLETRPERRKVGLLRVARLPPRQGRRSEIAHHLGDIDAANGAVGELELRGPVQRGHYRSLARAARGQVDGDGRVALDALKADGIVQEWIGVEIGERETEGLCRSLAGRIDAHHPGADAVIELEVRQFDLELAPGCCSADADGTGLDGAIAQMLDVDADLCVHGSQGREIDLCVAPA